VAGKRASPWLRQNTLSYLVYLALHAALLGEMLYGLGASLLALRAEPPPLPE